MKYIAEDIRLSIEDLVKTQPRELIIKKLALNGNKVKNFEITRMSLDSRFHNSKGIFRVFSVRFDYFGRIVSKAVHPEIKKSEAPVAFPASCQNRPFIIGSGPAGLFAAIRLIEHGIIPVIAEAGNDIEPRSLAVKKFWNEGILDPSSNIQFGLGGAGTFSDGKLNSRIKSSYARNVLETFVRFGAKKDILYQAKPHLGTDILKKIIASMRDYIIESGGEILFSSRVTDFIIKNGAITALIINDKYETEVTDVILACGNSARNTYEMLYHRGVQIIPKALAIGVRVEHSQEMIDDHIYGKYKNHPLLAPAEYSLTYHDNETSRGVYSFCNCPGGYVINSSSEEGRLCVNGMSYSRRNAENANAAIVVNINPADFPDKSVLGGVILQRQVEETAFNLGGGDYACPVYDIADFIGRGKTRVCIPSVKPAYRYCDISECFSEDITSALRRGLMHFSEQIKGFSDGVMTAVETRTSAAVRIQRRPDTLESVNTKGLFPVGEGAGYAGGILSSAVDGMKTADVIADKYKV